MSVSWGINAYRVWITVEKIEEDAYDVVNNRRSSIRPLVNSMHSEGR